MSVSFLNPELTLSLLFQLFIRIFICKSVIMLWKNTFSITVKKQKGEKSEISMTYLSELKRFLSHVTFRALKTKYYMTHDSSIAGFLGQGLCPRDLNYPRDCIFYGNTHKHQTLKRSKPSVL